MIETLDGMPPGVTGFQATGDLTKEDYRDVLVPALHEAAKTGEMRVLFVFDQNFEHYEMGALVEDAKAGLDRNLIKAGWKRCAVVTDVSWIQRTLHLFGGMAPGEVMGFGLADTEKAKAWVAG